MVAKQPAFERTVMPPVTCLTAKNAAQAIKNARAEAKFGGNQGFGFTIKLVKKRVGDRDQEFVEIKVTKVFLRRFCQFVGVNEEFIPPNTFMEMMQDIFGNQVKVIESKRKDTVSKPSTSVTFPTFEPRDWKIFFKELNQVTNMRVPAAESKMPIHKHQQFPGRH